MSSQEFLAERAWLAQSLRCDEADISAQLIAGDASPRKFYRVSRLSEERGHTSIFMVSPPTENNERFVLVHGLLEAADVRVPNLKRADLSLGVFLLEDLGEPFVSVSLHLPGDEFPLIDPWDIRDTLQNQVELVISGGYCGMEPTTVVELVDEAPVVLRQGRGELDQ